MTRPIFSKRPPMKTVPTSRVNLITIGLTIAFFVYGLPALGAQNTDSKNELSRTDSKDLISVDLNPAEIFLGEPAILEICLQPVKTGNWHVPIDLNLSPFIELSRNTEKRVEKENEIECTRIKLTTFNSLGDLKTPPINLDLVNTNGITQKTVVIPATDIRVLSMLEGIEDPQPRDIAGPLEIYVADLRLPVFALLFVIWFILALVLRNKVFEHIVPHFTQLMFESADARELALKKLHQIMQDNLLHRYGFQSYHQRISETIREYIGKQLGFFALDLTTCELLKELKTLSVSDVERSIVKKILEETDLVKFANHHPSNEKSKDLLNQAFQLVEHLNFTDAKMSKA